MISTFGGWLAHLYVFCKGGNHRVNNPPLSQTCIFFYVVPTYAFIYDQAGRGMTAT